MICWKAYFLKRNSKTLLQFFDKKTIPKNGSIPIYHPHGFVPFKKIKGKNVLGKIILSEDDYNSIANSNDYWANLLQIAQLSSGTGLMIGLSLTDRNLRRLLDLIVNIPITTNNYILLTKNKLPTLTASDVNEIKQNADQIINQMMNSGTKTQVKAFNNTKIILEEIFKMDNKINDRVFKQMKIKPIWFKDHIEMREFLRLIRGAN